MKPTIQVHRAFTVSSASEAAALLEKTVAAASRITALDSILWNYGDHRGHQGFDVARALTEAETRGGDGFLLGWTLGAASPDKTTQIAMTLNTRPPRPGSTCVFTLKPPDGVFSANRLGEFCVLLMDAFKADRAIVRTEDGTLLESCVESEQVDKSLLRLGKYMFRVDTSLCPLNSA